MASQTRGAPAPALGSNARAGRTARIKAARGCAALHSVRRRLSGLVDGCWCDRVVVVPGAALDPSGVFAVTAHTQPLLSW